MALPEHDGGGRMPAHPTLPGFASMWRGPSKFFNGKINLIVLYAVPSAKSVTFSAWPKTLKDLANKMAELAD